MIIVADNLQIVNPGVARAVASKDAPWIEALIRQCQQAGAQAIDINSGPLSRNPENQFRFLVESVQQVSDLPMLAAAGLDMVLMNVFHEQSVQTAIASRALLGDKIFSWAEIAPFPE